MYQMENWGIELDCQLSLVLANMLAKDELIL